MLRHIMTQSRAALHCDDTNSRQAPPEARGDTHCEPYRGRNVLEPEAVEQVEIGMTRSQVQFLLGTPMVADAFHEERWDYAYYLRRGRSRDIDRRWIVVYFEEDRVVRLDRDLILDPT